MSIENGTNFTMPVTPACYGNGGNGSMWGGDWSSWIILFLIFGMFGYGGYGGFGGGFGGGAGLQGMATRADINEGFALNNITSGIQAIQQGICDSTYALTNAVNSGFHGVDNAVCNLGYNVQAGFNAIGHQISDCCCTTQKAVGEVNFNLSKGFCDLGNVINMQTRDIIENQNANYRGIMDFMVQSKLDALRAENENLRLRASQADQNAVIRAAIDASTAEIIRRTGNDCPTPAYWVSPPTPVSVPFNNGCGCGI